LVHTCLAPLAYYGSFRFRITFRRGPPPLRLLPLWLQQQHHRQSMVWSRYAVTTQAAARPEHNTRGRAVELRRNRVATNAMGCPHSTHRRATTWTDVLECRASRETPTPPPAANARPGHVDDEGVGGEADGEVREASVPQSRTRSSRPLLLDGDQRGQARRILRRLDRAGSFKRRYSSRRPSRCQELSRTAASDRKSIGSSKRAEATSASSRAKSKQTCGVG
jgi:hypothetical protein